MTHRNARLQPQRLESWTLDVSSCCGSVSGRTGNFDVLQVTDRAANICYPTQSPPYQRTSRVRLTSRYAPWLEAIETPSDCPACFSASPRLLQGSLDRRSTFALRPRKSHRMTSTFAQKRLQKELAKVSNPAGMFLLPRDAPWLQQS